MLIPAFNQEVERGGYAWWYLDAISEDGRHGLTLIAFLGSVFSPYYAWARARGKGDPLAHCAINVALYGPSSRWCMTERSQPVVTRTSDSLRIGPSGLNWHDNHLRIDISERAAPLPRRIRGRIKVYPAIHAGNQVQLDPNGHHRWTPVFPSAQVDVSLTTPGLDWRGQGYLDHNAGSEPLEHGFQRWSWLRAATRSGPVVLYDTELKQGKSQTMALRFANSGEMEPLPSPKAVALPHSRWGIARPTRSDNGRARLHATWEDTPFYARSLIGTQLLGERVTAVHESLSLQRFSAPWVRLLLPFRMPRRT